MCWHAFAIHQLNNIFLGSDSSYTLPKALLAARWNPCLAASKEHLTTMWLTKYTPIYRIFVTQDSLQPVILVIAAQTAPFFNFNFCMFAVTDTSLTLSNVRPSHSGFYQCFVSNQVGTAHASISLNVVSGSPSTPRFASGTCSNQSRVNLQLIF